jgi:hypothetical protein
VFAGGINKYAYIGDSPSNHLDPSGLEKKDPFQSESCIPQSDLNSAQQGFDRHKFDYSFRSDHHISFQMSLKYKHLNGSRSGRPTEFASGDWRKHH